MSQIEKIKIFLASPSDVPGERRYVEDVVNEINRTIAPDKGVVLDLVSSKRAYPGYGKGGQVTINEQIGNMQEYELFIGIMWKRIGTATPRAKSGTVEEFERAVKNLNQNGKPQIFFYFRQSPAHFKTREELDQMAEVLKFREKFQSQGLFRDYKSPAEFRVQFREHLILWLSQRGVSIPQTNAVSGRKDEKAPQKSTKSPSSSRTRTVSSTGIKRKSSAVTGPGSWVMLNEKFFKAKSVSVQSDQSIVLKIAPTNMEQVAELKSFNPGPYHHNKQIAYADKHNSGLKQVSSVSSETTPGKSIFTIILSSIQRSQNPTFGMYNNYSSDEISELHARLILLNEPMPKDLSHFYPSIQFPGLFNNRVAAVEKGIFSELWIKLKTRSDIFLPKAWLTAAYYLKASQIIEDILELKLGPIKNKVMPIQFRGRRGQPYNQEPSIIEVAGNCSLNE